MTFVGLALLMLNAKLLALNVALIVLVAVFSVPFLLLFYFLLFSVGGGWAYAGSAGCYFVLNPFGWTMIVAPPVVVVCFVLMELVHRTSRRQQT
jgi:uncharacterized membrane protein